MDISVKVAGEAGQGVDTVGAALEQAFAGMGLYVFSTKSYMSRIRGGLNWTDVRVGDRELFSARESANLLVAFTREALDALRSSVTEGGVILFDGKDAASDGVLALPFAEVAQEVAGSKLMANSVAAGAVFAVLGYDCEELCLHFRKVFGKKGGEVAEQNARCARRGAELARKRAGCIKAPAPAGAPPWLYDASEAVALAAAAAGVKFAAAYPMTPSTGTFTHLAALADEYGIVVEQAEDEIAAVNMICGATYAGVPAMATTSGGGFALMVEGLSLAGMLELPIFILVAQRPGPATGLPTRTAQQDLRFVLHAGHGEFPRAIYAPGTPQQAYELVRRALETAHRYQTPVLMLTDQFIADCRRNGPELDRSLRPIDRCIVSDPPPDYVRYAVTDSGVSPRALPGGPAFVVVDSDEHTEDGHITEDIEARVRLQDKRMRKGRGLAAEALAPEVYGPPDAERVLLTWGSTYMPCREAVDTLQAGGEKVAMAHFAQVWPINIEAAHAALGGRRVVSVEGNCTGQFASLLREQGVLDECDLMLRYDGLPFTAEEIVRRLRQ
jgi:2-oxoglutarate ferredoxin oxidoreductase subunit alpha